ncbi:MAG: putative Ig domain-containing protein [Pseudomonadota bacterium]
MTNAVKALSVLVAVLMYVSCPAVCIGQDESEESRPAVTAAASFEPSPPRSGAPVKLRIRLGGNAIRAEVKWFINGEEVGVTDFDGVGPSVVLEQTMKIGDKIRAEVVPYDAYGNSGSPAVLDAECQNSAPDLKLTSQKLDGLMYTAKIKATDPEGSPVTLTLHKSPEGMTIDADGTIKWRITNETSGAFEVEVLGRDEQGAEAVASYTFNIHSSNKKKK